MTDNPSATPERPDAADRTPAAPALDRRRVPRNGRIKLHRDPAAIAGRGFDLVVVGGGAFGAWAAYDAAQRGLSVALLERHDFGAGVSAHALRTAHARPGGGGVSPGTLRRRAAERCVLMGVAPHLVQPLAVLAPRYCGGRWTALGMAARQALRAAATLGVGRRLHDPDRRDRWVGAMSAARLRRTLPELPRHRLAGAEQWPALQIVYPERLVLALVQSAACRGAKVLNHAEVDGLLFGEASDGDAVTGVSVSDRQSGQSFTVGARVVLNATGADSGDLLLRGNRPIELPAVAGRDELVLQTGRRLVAAGRALALPGGRDGRELVVAPSGQGGSLIGPWPLPAGVEPTAAARAAAVADCLAAVNRACPAWRLCDDDVDFLSLSRVPIAGPGASAADVIDHAERDGVSGLISLVGRRYGAAHDAASDALDRVTEALGLPEISSQTARVPLMGGDLPTVGALSAALRVAAADRLETALMDGLLRRHGAHAPALVRAAIDAGTAHPVAGTGVMAAELIHAAESEAAETLADAALRRAGLACWGRFPVDALTAAADGLAHARGWNDAERLEQLRRLRAAVAGHAPPGSPAPPPIASRDVGPEHAA